MTEDMAAKSRVAKDLEKVKELVRIFKSGGWYSDLSSGFALIQVYETRYGTTFDVVSRFRKATHFVPPIVMSKNHGVANTALSAFFTVHDTVCIPLQIRPCSP